MADVMSTACKPVTATWNRPPRNKCRNCEHVSDGGGWCNLRGHFTTWQGECPDFEPLWVVCKCGEDIEYEAGAFNTCPSCGRVIHHG